MRVLVVAEQGALRSELEPLLSAQSSLHVLGVLPPTRIGGEPLDGVPDVVAIATGPEEGATPMTLHAVRRAYPLARIVLFGGSGTTPADDLITRLRDVTARANPVALGDRIAALHAARRASEAEADVVVVGSSAGGPKALLRVVADLPADLPVPVALVQHMPMMFTRILAERLAAVSKIPVAEAVNGAALAPGTVWVAPGGLHLAVRRASGGIVMETSLGPEENSCRPSADVLFRSAAAAFGARVLAVVLSGMGKDGQKGCEAIRASGGRVLVQDQATSVVWGMPGAVYRAGLADAVLPLEDIAAEIVRRTRTLGSVEVGGG